MSGAEVPQVRARAPAVRHAPCLRLLTAASLILPVRRPPRSRQEAGVPAPAETAPRRPPREGPKTLVIEGRAPRGGGANWSTDEVPLPCRMRVSRTQALRFASWLCGRLRPWQLHPTPRDARAQTRERRLLLEGRVGPGILDGLGPTLVLNDLRSLHASGRGFQGRVPFPWTLDKETFCYQQDEDDERTAGERTAMPAAPRMYAS